MKTMRLRGQAGNTLMLTLIFCLAVGMVLAATLKLIQGRYKTTVRSTDWNEAIPVLESGIEEAMTHMRDDVSPSTNGWAATTLSNQLVYRKQRTFTDGSYFYTTIYSPSSNAPYIISQGYVRSPLNANKYIARTVLVTTTNPPNVFTKAIATTGNINFSGTNPSVDSYDSAKGAYDAITNHGSMGNIATDSTANPAVNLGGGIVNGSVTTGPGGTVTGGTVTGATNNNMNVSFPSNTPPANLASFTAPPNPTTISNLFAYYIPAGNYRIASFSSIATPIIITGNVTIYCDGDCNISGTGYIQIMPGASVTMYMGGNFNVSGNGVVNGGGLAQDFNLLGLSSCTSLSYTGNAVFNGTVYAPQADCTIKGNGGIYGAVIAKTATLTGNANFHYDTELAKVGGLVATGWTEL